jgi:hypothetical protein
MKRALLTAVLALAAVVLAPVSAFAADGLMAAATPDTGTPGALVRVDGANWTPGARLQVVTCGALGIGGSASCDLAATYTPIANNSGAFQAYVALGKPPVPCPCVLHVSDANSSAAVDIPVVVVGQPLATPPKPDLGASNPLTVASAQLTGWGPWTAFFGAGPQRTLVLTVHNNTAQPVRTARLVLFNGTSQSGGGPLSTTEIGPIPAGAASTFQVPVALPGGVGGDYTVTGTIDGGAAFAVTTSSRAWGFYTLDVILLGLLVLVIVARLRQRRGAGGVGRHSLAPSPVLDEVAGDGHDLAESLTGGSDVVPFPRE